MFAKVFLIGFMFVAALVAHSYWHYAVVPEVNDQMAYNQLDHSRSRHEQQNMRFWQVAKQYPGTIIWTSFSLLTLLTFMPELKRATKAGKTFATSMSPALLLLLLLLCHLFLLFLHLLLYLFCRTI